MKIRVLTAACLLALAGSAVADPFYLEVGSYGDTNTVGPGIDADTRTNDLDSLGFTDTKATSIYLGLTPGSTVIDTNDDSVMATYGIAPVIDPDDRLISDLNAFSPPLGDTEAFSDDPNDWGVPTSYFDGTDFYLLGGTGWGLTYTYVLNGEINATGTGVDFTSGYFDLFFRDGTITDQLLRLELSNLSLTDGGATYTVIADGNVTFNWDADADPDASAFAQDFFVDAATGISFYDLWLDGGDIDPLAISWRIDNNIDCPTGQTNCTGVPLQSQLTAIIDPDTQEVIGGWRQTTTDGTVRFFVPEPTALALLSIGLLGAASARKRKHLLD